MQLSNNIWIGDSIDERAAQYWPHIGAVLNVAHDLQGTCGWKDGVEYLQVGLVDGPGNPPAAYYAAVLALAAIRQRDSILVCCHTGGRALAVALMYLCLVDNRSWDDRITLLRERTNSDLPGIHEAHKEAFLRMDWRHVAIMVRDK